MLCVTDQISSPLGIRFLQFIDTDEYIVADVTHNETISQTYKRLKHSPSQPEALLFAPFLFRENPLWWKAGLVTLGFVERIKLPRWIVTKMVVITSQATSLSVHTVTSPSMRMLRIDEGELHLNHYYASQRERTLTDPNGFVPDTSALPYVPQLLNRLKKEYASEASLWNSAVQRGTQTHPLLVL